MSPIKRLARRRLHSMACRHWVALKQSAKKRKRAKTEFPTPSFLAAGAAPASEEPERDFSLRLRAAAPHKPPVRDSFGQKKFFY